MTTAVASLDFCNLHNCDARSLDLRAVADVVATDPPYRLTSGGKNAGGPSGGWMNDYQNDGAPVECEITWPEIMALIFRALKSDGDAYVMANDKNVIPAGVAAIKAGFGVHNLLVWDKIAATPNRWYMKNCEFVLYLWKGRATRINDPSSKQVIRAPQIDVTSHPTEKPVALMRHYIENSSQPGDTVLDPFMGSGTTGVAAIEARRRFIGVEIDNQHFETARLRLEGAGRQGELLEGIL